MDSEQGLPLPQRYWAIAVVALGITLAVLDGAIANVALPIIARNRMPRQPTPSGSSTRISWPSPFPCCPSPRSAAASATAGCHGGARALHGVVVRVRAVRLARRADHRARRAGFRRGRHHERQHGARAHHLSPRPARARCLHQRDGRRHLLGHRADGRLRRARHRAVAVALNVPIGLAAFAIGWTSLPRTPGIGSPTTTSARS